MHRSSIVIVDDHILIAKALAGIIERFPQYEVLYECENGRVFIDQLDNRKNVPDIVLLDIGMPVMDGFETATWLRSKYPQILIMALTMRFDDASLLKMIQCGVNGYISKNISPPEFENALDMLVKNGIYYSHWATVVVMKNVANSGVPSDLGVALSDREKEFLIYCCTNLTYREIGVKMFCSARTVEGYRDSLFEKLDINTRVELALYAVKIGLYKL